MATERLQLPSFNHNVQDWLLHVQGYLANTSANDQQKFNAVVCALPTEVATLVQSAITSPPDSNKFADLKCSVRRVPKTRPPSSTGAANHHFGGHEAVYSVAADATNQYTVQHVIANSSASIHVSSEVALGGSYGPDYVLVIILVYLYGLQGATDLTYALASRLVYRYGLQGAKDLTYALASRLVYLHGLLGYEV
ncbi:hypothetical protein GWK47_026367 [Chionoecetes opilio]|uniref:Uncharacterized protein n=1 Tax=Chionoecetes opilio TaxID=41210 RepID=A0A8J8WML4_CHIOP|nr:hypothetical protein GWK47_026367 [Chionoecetes opilio]